MVAALLPGVAPLRRPAPVRLRATSLYADLFGADCDPRDTYLQEAYQARAKLHLVRVPRCAITVNGDYSFQEGSRTTSRSSTDLVGRRFKRPKEGLGFGGSSVARMRRMLIDPTRLLLIDGGRLCRATAVIRTDPRWESACARPAAVPPRRECLSSGARSRVEGEQ